MRDENIRTKCKSTFLSFSLPCVEWEDGNLGVWMVKHVDKRRKKNHLISIRVRTVCDQGEDGKTRDLAREEMVPEVRK